LKVQAKAKLYQISGDPVPREGVVQDMRLEVWRFCAILHTDSLSRVRHGARMQREPIRGTTHPTVGQSRRSVCLALG
jgi:hypothetical protein